MTLTPMSPVSELLGIGAGQVLEAAGAGRYAEARGPGHDDLVGRRACDENAESENVALGGAEIDSHRSCCALVAELVHAAAAVDRIAVGAAIDEIVPEIAGEGIRAAATFDDIVAETACQPVGVGISAQRVGIDRAFDRLDAEQPVALGVAAVLRRAKALEVDIDGPPGRDVGCPIDARRAVRFDCVVAIEMIPSPAAEQ